MSQLCTVFENHDVNSNNQAGYIDPTKAEEEHTMILRYSTTWTKIRFVRQLYAPEAHVGLQVRMQMVGDIFWLQRVLAKLGKNSVQQKQILPKFCVGETLLSNQNVARPWRHTLPVAWYPWTKSLACDRLDLERF